MPCVEPGADLLRRDRAAATLVPGDDRPGGCHPGEASESEQLPGLHRRLIPIVVTVGPSPLPWSLPVSTTSDPTRSGPTGSGSVSGSVSGPGPGPGSVLRLDRAAELSRTGDLWLFRGRSAVDHAIRAVTNSPVNHVGMAVVIEDLPPLLWHAELGQSLEDAWTGTHHRGVQLHDLTDAVLTWSRRYGQQAWLRQLDATVTRPMEDELLRVIARMDGTPFPSTAALVGRWARGRVRRPAPVESTYCAEVVAATYQAMGLLPTDRPANFYDPGSFWSGDGLVLAAGAVLGQEIRVDVGGHVDGGPSARTQA